MSSPKNKSKKLEKSNKSNFSLNSWESKKLGDVCSVIAGQSPEGKYYNQNGKGMPFYQGKKEFKEKYIGQPTTWTTITTKVAEAGDILMSVRAPVGPVNFATQKICIGRGLAAIRSSNSILSEFLFHYLIKHESEITGNAGAVFNSINKAQIEAIEIPLPSVPEQKRIVAILNECFAAIDETKAMTEQNLKNAKDLFERYLQDIYNPNTRSVKRIMQEEWNLKRLGEICKIIPGQSPEGRFYNHHGKGTPFYQGKKEFGSIFIGAPTTWTTKTTKVAESGDILISVRAPVGPVNFATQRICIGRGLAAIRPSKSILKEYLFNYLIKHENEITGNEGAVFSSINKAQIEALTIPTPSLSVQKSIVGQIENFRIKAQRLEALYRQKIKSLEELKKSILEKAFRGELN
jgi:type I restriction enzyme S subunit